MLTEASPDRALTPASNTKLVTAALALDRLGPEYRFETDVVADGSLEDSRLDGDLRLVGRGAPDLAVDDLQTMAAQVAEQVDHVAGDLVVDGSYFDGPDHGPGWTVDDEQHAYGARSTAVALAKNIVSISIAGESGEDDLQVTPDSPAIEVHDRTLSGQEDPAADEFRATTDHESGAVVVEGPRHPVDADSESLPSAKAPVSDPERHCGEVLLTALAAAGVAVSGSVEISQAAVHVEDESVLATVQSAPVSDLVRSMNVPSDNFVAAQLARAVAAAETGTGSWSDWRTVAESHFTALGVETVSIRDGSGLSRYNLLSADALVGLLRWALDQSWGDVFVESLPAAGEGTLVDRLAGTPVRAKTGTVTGTAALSGYLGPTADSEVTGSTQLPEAVFSVVYGGLTSEDQPTLARERQDAFVRSISDRI